MLKKITPAIAALAAAQALSQTWSETFETGSKASYAEGDVVCVMGAWHMDQCLLGSSSGDRYFGNQGVRMKPGRLEMNFDKTNGVETFSACFAKYGSDGDSAVTVECSTDGSNSWFQAGAPVAVTSTVLTYVSVAVHTNGAVRFRVVNAGPSRVNVDNVMITDFGVSGVPPLIDPVAAQNVRVGQSLAFALTVTPTDGDVVTATNVTASAGVTGGWGLTNGVFSYTPAAADVGLRTFIFTADDKDGSSTPVEAAVMVGPPQPVAVRMRSATGVYEQNFDALATTGSANVWENAADPLPAWYAFANASEVASYRAGTGSGTSGGLYSFEEEGNTNRSLGTLAGSGMTYRFGVALTNETGLVLTNLSVSFTAAQWRVANGVTNTLAFEFCVTNRVVPLCQGEWTPVSELGFDSPVVTNGAQLAGAVHVSERRSATLPVLVPAAQVVILRWRDVDDAGPDHAFGIDDLAVAWAAQREKGGTVFAVR